MHGERGKPNREAADGALVLAARRAVDDRADVGRGAAHVERQRVVDAGEPCDLRGPDHACRWTGEKRERGMSGRLLHGCEATGGAHDERLQQALLAACSGKGEEVPAENGAEVRVDGRRGRSLVLTELGRHLVRGDDVSVRVPPAELGRDCQLVLRVTEREQEADGDGIGVDPVERLQVEWDKLPVGSHPLPHARTALERDERRRMIDARAVEIGAGLAAQVEQVFEARCRHERGRRAAPLEERVRRDRGPVREAVDLVCPDELGRREHGLLLSLRGRYLRSPHDSVGDENRVGEGAADVHSEECWRRLHRRILIEVGQ